MPTRLYRIGPGRWQSKAFSIAFVVSDALSVSAAFYLSFYLAWQTRKLLGRPDVGRPTFELTAKWANLFLDQIAEWTAFLLSVPADRSLAVYASLYIVLANLFILYLLDMYDTRRFISRESRFIRVFEGIFIFSLIHGFILLVFANVGVSRLLIAYFLILGAGLVSANRTILAGIRRRLRMLRTFDSHPVIVVGTGREALSLAGVLAGKSSKGYVLLGLAGFSEDRPKSLPETARYLGSAENIAELISTLGAHEVFVADQTLGHAEILKIVAEARKTRVAVRVLTNKLNVIVERAQPRADVVEGTPLIDFGYVSEGRLASFAKRATDVAISLFVLIAFSWLLALIWVAIRLDSKGPALFRQTRLTKDLREFEVLKFRSMIAGADAQKAGLLALNERSGAIFKMERDPRITRVGKFLRRFSLDELPQFVNVLLGEMSIVGPRPPLPSEIPSYDEWHLGRLCGKTGITGLWQVSGRSELDFDEMALLDIYYLSQMSFKTDLKILLRTAFAVVGGRGAR
ncbi:MAG: sugar transferase [Planctomycetes bacterium]|nr:sugar transferase [Planctomycetota bacterium]